MTTSDTPVVATGGVASIEPAGAGTFRIAGELDFASVPALYARAVELFADCPSITLDLGGVTRANSAGLALLLEWQGQSRRAGRPLMLQNVPARLVNLARISELEDVLPLGGAAAVASGETSKR